jgi:hypothetical protein
MAEDVMLVRCSQCGTQISTARERCPQCGHQNPNPPKLSLAVLAIVLIGIVAIIITAVLKSNPNDVSASAAPPTNAATSDAAPLSSGVTARLSSNDPYAKEQTESLMSRYIEDRSTTIELIRKMYFAQDCKVFGEGADIWIFYNTEANALEAELMNSNLQDANLTRFLEQARQYGKNLAAQSNGCAYWHDNPDEVVAARQIIETVHP